jgi:cob(I)alamin adenosyltransferase
MRKERVEAVQTVAEKLFALEEAIDAAIGAAAELGSTMVQARTHALSRLVEARSKTVETHGALDEVKSELGLRTFAFGGGMQKPIDPIALRAVEQVAA